MLGATGSGKSFLLNFLLTHLQKYDPLTTIFDLGGSYESLTTLFDGRYVPLGLERRPCTINPFSLPPTPAHLQFLVVVREGAGRARRAGRPVPRMTSATSRPQVENLYALDPDQRRLCTLATLLNRPLERRSQPWVGEGPYAALFDHVEDTAHVGPVSVFRFRGDGPGPGARRAVALLRPASGDGRHPGPARRSRPSRSSCIDEAWRFLRHPTLQRYVTEALKTWRRQNAALILATQSSDDLAQSALLQVAVESCPTMWFLANPGLDPALYQRLFHLTETDTARIATLVPKRQVLLKRAGFSKVLNLQVDPREYWLYTSQPFEQRRRQQVVRQYGLARGLEILAQGGAQS